MVSSLILLAHGADPTPLAWDEALANLVKFSVTFLIIGFMSYPVLAPLMNPSDGENPDSGAADSMDPLEVPPISEEARSSRNEILGWIATGLLVVLAVGWWLARTSLVEISMDAPLTQEEHAHSQTEGGQVAMWGDFHAEVVRVESGELRVYLRDSYNRDIAARFFEAEIQELSPEKKDDEALPALEQDANSPTPKPHFVETQSSLNDAYRFARLGLKTTSYRVKVSTPGWSAALKFDFDGSQGRRSLPIWCATPKK